MTCEMVGLVEGSAAQHSSITDQTLSDSPRETASSGRAGRVPLMMMRTTFPSLRASGNGTFPVKIYTMLSRLHTPWRDTR